MNITFLLDPIRALREGNEPSSNTVPLMTRKELKNLYSQDKEFSGGDIKQILKGSTKISSNIPEERDIIRNLFKIDIKVPSKIEHLRDRFPDIYDSERWIVGESIHFRKRLYDYNRSGEEFRLNKEYRNRVLANIVHYASGLSMGDRLNRGKIGKYVAISGHFKYKIPFIIVNDTNNKSWKVVLITLLSDDMKVNLSDPYMIVEKDSSKDVDITFSLW